jgi:hypothetical protein
VSTGHGELTRRVSLSNHRNDTGGVVVGGDVTDRLIVRSIQQVTT